MEVIRMAEQNEAPSKPKTLLAAIKEVQAKDSEPVKLSLEEQQDYQKEQTIYDVYRQVQSEQAESAAPPPSEVKLRLPKKKEKPMFHPIDGSTHMKGSNERASKR